MKAIKIGLATAFAIMIMQCLGMLVVYNFLTFDIYATIIAITFLAVGYYLIPRWEPNNLPTEIPIQNLTGRELSIFKFLAQGKTNKEIADIMAVEVSTVKTHTHNLYSKMGCKNRIEARNLWLKIGPFGAL